MERVCAKAEDTVSISVNPALLPFREASRMERDSSTSSSCELICSKPFGARRMSVLFSLAMSISLCFRSESPFSSSCAVMFTCAIPSSRFIAWLPAKPMAAIPVTNGFFRSPAPGIESNASDAHFLNLPPLAAVSRDSSSSVSLAISLLYSRMAAMLSAGIHSLSACNASIFIFRAPMLLPVSRMMESAAAILSRTPEMAAAVLSEVAEMPFSLADILSCRLNMYSILFDISC